MPTATAQLDSPWNRAKGDMTGDGVVNASDVSTFETALSNLASYHSTYPMLDGVARGDCNDDGSLDSSDLSAFEGLIAQTLALPFVSHAPTLQSRRNANGIALNDIGHQGLMHDEEFQTANGSLVHNRARTLHPGMRRFVQRDPWMADEDGLLPTAGDGYQDGLGAYTYLDSRPFHYRDPMGTALDSPTQSILNAAVRQQWDEAIRLIKCTHWSDAKKEVWLRAVKQFQNLDKWRKQMSNLSLKEKKARLKSLKKSLKEHQKKYGDEWDERSSETLRLKHQVEWLERLINKG